LSANPNSQHLTVFILLSAVIILSAILLINCKNGGDGDSVNNPPATYDLIAPDFIPINFDDTLGIYLTVDDLQGLDDIESVYFVRENPDGSFAPDTAYMNDDGLREDKVAGDGIYSYGLTGSSVPQDTGEYVYHFTARDIQDAYSEPLAKTISFNSMQGPFMFNLVAPDSLLKGSSEAAFLFIKAWDPGGLDNIDSVYFTVLKPDSTSNNVRYMMYDDGALISHGDSIAGDGVFSLGIQPPSNESQSGSYVFTFTATDIFHNHGNSLAKVIVAYEETLTGRKRAGEYKPDLTVKSIW
jgi:hypothetical protein